MSLSVSFEVCRVYGVSFHAFVFIVDGRFSTARPLPRFGAGKGLKVPLLDFLETLATMVGQALRSLIDLGLQMAANWTIRDK